MGPVTSWLRRRRERNMIRVPFANRRPIVLVHGIMGFDRIGRKKSKGYFKDLTMLAHHQQVELLRPRVPRVASIRHRAEKLCEYVEQLSNKRVDIIAHSMGGIDARYAIAKLGLHTRVATLVTIGCPHYGTPLADLGRTVFGEQRAVRKLLQIGGWNVDAFWEMSTSRMDAFNADVQDHPEVTYYSVVGSAPRARDVPAILKPSFAYLTRASGANDGVVPKESQPWGEVIDEVEAHHWAQIGWSTRGFDAQDFYKRLFERLAMSKT